jgi:predicted DNA-binding antitoxin AbrB/MazE fold protein
MGEILTAVYENGVLRLLEPVTLQERQTVRIQVLSEKSGDAADQVIQGLIGAGVLTPPPGHSDVALLPEAERRALADRLGRAPGKRLSELIIEERAPR